MTPLARLVRFNVAGALGIGVQLTVLWALTHVLSLDAVVATAFAVLAAVAHNFLWHWHWTWADRALPPSRAPATFARFVLANGVVSLVGNVLLMDAFVRAAQMPPLAANLVAITACGGVNFWLGDRAVFAPQLDPFDSESRQFRPGATRPFCASRRD